MWTHFIFRYYKRKFKQSEEDSDDNDDESRKKQKVCNDTKDKNNFAFFFNV